MHCTGHGCWCLVRNRGLIRALRALCRTNNSHFNLSVSLGTFTSKERPARSLPSHTSMVTTCFLEKWVCVMVLEGCWWWVCAMVLVTTWFW
jgi:hypothetical protein